MGPWTAPGFDIYRTDFSLRRFKSEVQQGNIEGMAK